MSRKQLTNVTYRGLTAWDWRDRGYGLVANLMETMSAELNEMVETTIPPSPGQEPLPDEPLDGQETLL